MRKVARVGLCRQEAYNCFVVINFDDNGLPWLRTLPCILNILQRHPKLFNLTYKGFPSSLSNSHSAIHSSDNFDKNLPRNPQQLRYGINPDICQWMTEKRKCGTYAYCGLLPNHKKEWNPAFRKQLNATANHMLKKPNHSPKDKHHVSLGLWQHIHRVQKKVSSIGAILTFQHLIIVYSFLPHSWGIRGFFKKFYICWNCYLVEC